MMKSEVKVFDRGNGELQRVHMVSWEDWSQLDFLYLFYHISLVFAIIRKAQGRFTNRSPDNYRLSFSAQPLCRAD